MYASKRNFEDKSGIKIINGVKYKITYDYVDTVFSKGSYEWEDDELEIPFTDKNLEVKVRFRKNQILSKDKAEVRKPIYNIGETYDISSYFTESSNAFVTRKGDNLPIYIYIYISAIQYQKI